MEKPEYLKPNFEKIPQELKDRPQWVLWIAEFRDGKHTKVPYSINGNRGSSINPKTWDSFETISNVYSKNGHKYDGIGFVLTKEDPFTGWDFDKCRDPETNETDPDIRENIKLLNSYFEVSPSGTGYRGIVKADLPPNGRKNGTVECYQDGRYLTITGHSLEGTPKTIENRQQETTTLHNKYFPGKNEPIKQQSNQYIDDHELLERAFNSVNGDKIRRLYNGDDSDYPSPSEADQALCNYLAFWLDRDAARIDRAFRTSGLYRKKWDKNHFSDGRTYGQETINKAISSCVEVYQGNQKVVVLSTKESPWGNPVDIFNESLIINPAWEKEYSPDVISKLGYDFAERMGIRPEQVIGPAIINAGGVIDDNFKLQPKEYDHTWSESARLNAAILGLSGSKKSPAKQQVDKIVKSIQKEMIETHMKEMEYYESLDKKEQKNTPEPILKRIICGDSTIEGLRGILKKDGGARKINCSWDEMSGWLGSFDTYRKTGNVSRDRAAFMELYEGGPKYFDRVNAGFIYVPNWSTCICGTITPSLMADFFGKLNTDGLIQRFLLYQAEQTGSGIDRKPDDFLIERYETTIRNLTKLKPEGIETFKLDQDAQEVREEFERLVGLAVHLPGATEAFKAHLNKYPGMFCRLSLTYHIADAVSNKQEPSKRVPGKITAMAAGALISYHMPLARNFYKTLGYEDKIENEAEDVCNFILAKKYIEISSREIAQKVKSLKNNTAEIRNVMEILEAYGWVKTSKTVGLKATWWKINPEVHKLFEKQANSERKRRQEEKAKILKAVDTFRQNIDNVDCAREENIK